MTNLMCIVQSLFTKRMCTETDRGWHLGKCVRVKWCVWR